MPTQRVRIPKLLYTESRGLGWHVNYRDPATGIPRKHRFGKLSEGRVKVAYTAWIAVHLKHRTTVDVAGQVHTEPPVRQVNNHPDSLLAVASALLRHDESRKRGWDEPARPGTLNPEVYQHRAKGVKEFLAYLNAQHGQGAVGRMTLAHLMMGDVEGYNRAVAATHSNSQTAKRMQLVRRLIERAGRPEHGQQVLPWNWASLDRVRGKPTQVRSFPTLDQFRALLAAADLRGQTLIWAGAGLGFGPRDLSELRVQDIDSTSYDLRRSKTGIERFGSTPAQVWVYVDAYKREHAPDGRMFTTRKGFPLLHEQTDSIALWWDKLRKSAGVKLGGFYVLRHIGATEFGSRPGCSISGMRQWLGHSISSRVADLYMRPVSPEHRALIEWLRSRLSS